MGDKGWDSSLLEGTSYTYTLRLVSVKFLSCIKKKKKESFLIVPRVDKYFLTVKERKK